MRKFVITAAVAVAMALAACEKAPPPPPPGPVAEVPGDVVGHFCGMYLSEHEGPKGQAHLSSRDTPLWFTSVSQTIAFLRLPDEPGDVTAVYVNDMGQAENWDQPESDTWISLRDAWLVLNSDQRGGMNEDEAVPFGDEATARAFAEEHGGQVVRLDEVPDAYVMGSGEAHDHDAHESHD